MASAISHAVAAVALGSALRPQNVVMRFWILGAACAVLPDIDVVGLRFGIEYGDILGHRGLTHSLLFAAVLSTVVVVAFFQGAANMRRLWVCFFIATASHGVLDALTNGGLGVAFFAPFDATRYVFPFRPIEVSPLSVRAFLSARGVIILLSEIRWIWVPSFVLMVLVWMVRARRRPPRSDDAVTG